MEDMRLDGNAVAGVLRELFVEDVTAAHATCAACGRIAEVGAMHEYGSEMGVVLRCTGCEAAVLRLVRTPGRMRIDFSGISFLTIPE